MAGDVEDANSFSSGYLCKCRRHKQAVSLLSITTHANVSVVVSPHMSLNSSKGTVRGRGRFLAHMTENDILEEPQSQNVMSVKRLSSKRNIEVPKTNTYFLTFGPPKIPDYFTAGYCNIKVDMHIPNPLRCLKCHHYGHGSRTCDKQAAFHRCGGNCADSAACDKDPSCVNFGGNLLKTVLHSNVQKSKIVKVKDERNISKCEEDCSR